MSIASAGSIQPSRPPASHAADVVAARQHGDAGARADGAFDDEIGQAAAGVARHHHILLVQRHAVQRSGEELDAPCEARPALDERLVQRRARRRQRACRPHRARRRVVEDQHDLREQAVSGGQVDDASAAEEPPRPACDLPGFVELFARQAARGADGAADAIEQGCGGKPLEVVGVRRAFDAGEKARLIVLCLASGAQLGRCAS